MENSKRQQKILSIKNSQKLNINKNTSNHNSETVNSKDDSNNYIDKSILVDLLKCELCDNVFDTSNHIPMVTTCGHTFCKKCILDINERNQRLNTYEPCPYDNTENIFDIETCVVNLRLELIIKKLFMPNQKHIIYSKPDIKKNKIHPHNNINNQKTEFDFGKNKQEEGIINKQIEEEINFNKNNILINETIETIPIFDEKSFANMSFKEDMIDLFTKKNTANNKIPQNINTDINNDRNLNNKKITEIKINSNFSLTPNKKLLAKSTNDNNELNGCIIKDNKIIIGNTCENQNNDINFNTEKNSNVLTVNKLNLEKNPKIKNDISIPSKKIILFSNSTSDTSENNNNNFKSSIVLNKNALNSQTLKNNNKNDEEEKSPKIKIKKRNNYNSIDMENEACIKKNKTFNSQKNDSVHMSILEHSKNDSINMVNGINKNIRILNKSNNSSIYSIVPKSQKIFKKKKKIFFPKNSTNH